MRRVGSAGAKQGVNRFYTFGGPARKASEADKRGLTKRGAYDLRYPRVLGEIFGVAVDDKQPPENFFALADTPACQSKTVGWEPTRKSGYEGRIQWRIAGTGPLGEPWFLRAGPERDWRETVEGHGLCQPRPRREHGYQPD